MIVKRPYGLIINTSNIFQKLNNKLLYIVITKKFKHKKLLLGIGVKR